MTNRLLPGERLDEAGDVTALGNAAQRERGQLQAGDPALGALLERLHVGRGEVEAHHLVEEVARLGRGEAQVGGAELGQLPAAAQPRQRQRRVGAGGHQQVQLLRQRGRGGRSPPRAPRAPR